MNYQKRVTVDDVLQFEDVQPGKWKEHKPWLRRFKEWLTTYRGIG